MKSFNANLAHLGEKNPRLALKLTLEPSRGEVLPARPFLPNKTSLKSIDFLYLFGWEGGEENLSSLLKWLFGSQKRELILLSSDISRLAKALEEPSWEALLKEKRVKCTLLDDALSPMIWKALYRNSSFLNLAVPKTPLAREGEECRELVKELEWEAKATLSSASDFGVRPFENLCRNLLITDELIEASTLWKTFSGVPALICGAGPSLEKQLGALKEIKGRALLIAAGSALNCLEKGGITPDFGVAIDPDMPIERVRRQKGFALPFFYQQQLCPHLFALLQGEKIATLGSASSPLEQGLLHRLGIKSSPFEAGWNGVTFAAHLAYQLGCSPLIFVGVDGCVQGDNVYTSGAAYPDEWAGCERVNKIKCVNQAGEITHSRPDLLLGRKWLNAFASSHFDATWINATEGGMAFAAIPDQPLDKVIKERLGRYWDIEGRVHRATTLALRKRVKKNEVIEQMLHIEKSVLKCRSCLTDLLDQTKAKHRGRALVARVELEEEPFWQTQLAPLWDIWSHVLKREEVVEKMEDVAFETALLQALFWQRVCSDYLASFERLKPVIVA